LAEAGTWQRLEIVVLSAADLPRSFVTKSANGNITSQCLVRNARIKSFQNKTQMILTIKEAESLLNKIFKDDLGGTLVKIDDGPNAFSYSRVSKQSLDMLLHTMMGRNEKIAAIKLYREFNPGSGLADAKQYVESL
jgi:ribosomal protein L7/L12